MCLLDACSITFAPPPPLPLLQIPVPEPGKYRVILDSDAWDFGGAGRVGHDVDHFSAVGGMCGSGACVCVCMCGGRQAGRQAGQAGREATRRSCDVGGRRAEETPPCRLLARLRSMRPRCPPSACLQPAGTEEEPDKTYYSRGQFIYVLSPSRTVVAYKKVEEGPGAPPAGPPPAVQAISAAGRRS